MATDQRTDEDTDDTPWAIIWSVVGGAVVLALGVVVAVTVFGAQQGGRAGLDQAPWVVQINQMLREQRGFDFVSVSAGTRDVIVAGTAPDPGTRDAAWTAAEAAVRASPEAGGFLVVDALGVEGGEAGLGAALVALGERPDIARCQAAFGETLAGRFVAFREGSAEIEPASARLLDALTGVAMRCEAHRIEVGGHTSTTGDDASNLALSRDRAEAVKAHLVSRGVPAASLAAVGYGEARLLDTAGTPEAEARNRRIEFTVTPSMDAPAGG